MDGTGMQPIEDESLAVKLREKVNAFNSRGSALPAALTVAFVALPEVVGFAFP